MIIVTFNISYSSDESVKLNFRCLIAVNRKGRLSPCTGSVLRCSATRKCHDSWKPHMALTLIIITLLCIVCKCVEGIGSVATCEWIWTKEHSNQINMVAIIIISLRRLFHHLLYGDLHSLSRLLCTVCRLYNALVLNWCKIIVNNSSSSSSARID